LCLRGNVAGDAAPRNREPQSRRRGADREPVEHLARIIVKQSNGVIPALTDEEEMVGSHWTDDEGGRLTPHRHRTYATRCTGIYDSEGVGSRLSDIGKTAIAA